MSTTVYQLGMDQTLTINSNEVSTVRGVTISRTADEIDVTCRGAGGYHRSQPGLRSVEMSFQLQEVSTSDSLISGLISAYEATSLSSQLVAATAGGVSGNWIITKLDKSEDLNEAVLWDVTLKLYELTTTSSDSSSS